jgi:hypothetical protein
MRDRARQTRSAGGSRTGAAQTTATTSASERSDASREPVTLSTSSLPLEVLLGALAPVTIITGLLVYLGYMSNRAYFTYFGISQSLLDVSMESYVLRSADVTFGSSTRLAAIAALLVLTEWAVAQLQRRRQRAGRLAIVAIRTGALVAILAGLYFAFGGPVPRGTPSVALPIALAVGSIVILRQLRLARSSPEATTSSSMLSDSQHRLARTVLLTFLVLAAFWGANLYAVESGRTAARIDDSTPGRLPLVTVFSEKFLDLPGTNVDQSEISITGQDVHYRYAGLRLLRYANERWFLVTGSYGDQYASPVAVLRDDSSIRVEVAGVRNEG